MLDSSRLPRPFHAARRPVGVAAAVIVAAQLLTACAGPVPMDAAADANDPACAEVIVRLPSTVSDLPKRSTNAQATGAWGDPALVQLRCGIEPSGPTTDTCVNVNGVDWIVDESQAPLYRFEAYGRTPGLEVFVDGDEVSGTNVITDLSGVAQQLPQERSCVSLQDTMELEADPNPGSGSEPETLDSE